MKLYIRMRMSSCTGERRGSSMLAAARGNEVKELGDGGRAQTRDFGGSFDAAGLVLEQQGSFFNTGPPQTLCQPSHGYLT